MTAGGFNTLRFRIVAGLAALLGGLAVTAIVGARALRTMRHEIGQELALLRASSEIGNGLVSTVFDEIRAAEQYLAAPSPAVRAQFQDASDAAFDYSRRLEKLEGLTV